MSLRFVFEFLLDTCTLDSQQFNINISSSSGTVNVVLFNDGGAGGLCDGQAVDRSRGKRLATTEKLRWLVFISAAVLVVAGVCVCVCACSVMRSHWWLVDVLFQTRRSDINDDDTTPNMPFVR